MKITKYVMVFLIIVMLYFAVQSHAVLTFNNVTNKKAEFNKALDTAIDAAMEGIVESADGSKVEIDRDACITNFYDTLYATFGAIDSKVTQERLHLYTPVLAVVENEGLYVHYNDIINGTMESVWSQKIPFTCSKSVSIQQVTYDCTIAFTLDDNVKLNVSCLNKDLIASGGDTLYEGHFNELRTKYPESTYKTLHLILNESVLKDYDTYTKWKTQVITETITDKLNYYVNRHNRIGQLYGEQFTFTLPDSAESVIARNLEDVSFLCFFQGYPYGAGTTEVYSSFEISGARVAKSSGYYLGVIEDYLYYHKRQCNSTKFTAFYYTKEECAMEGALPCPYCHP